MPGGLTCYLSRAPPACGRLREVSSDRPDVGGLRALLALRHVELDALVLVERAVAVGLDRREVHEDVGAAAVLCDEAEALLSVEPLHRALRHAVSSWDACRPALCGPSVAATGRIPPPALCRVWETPATNSAGVRERAWKWEG